MINYILLSALSADMAAIVVLEEMAVLVVLAVLLVLEDAQ